jgi:metal-dependent HD superfamily phosphatase/phosphodiesterase
MKSPKECSLERKIIRFLKKLPVAEALAGRLFADPELQAQQEYANTVSIRRLGFNDHGPVHMRKVAFNALQMLSLLHDAGIPTSLEQDEAGSLRGQRLRRAPRRHAPRHRHEHRAP